MSAFPKLSYVCPIPWSALKGDERKRFCEKCGLHVSNLSEMGKEERETLLRQVGKEQLCVSFYLRLSGEYVTPEAPLTRAERSKIGQYGVAALSAGALALAAGCASVAPPRKSAVPPERTNQQSGVAPKSDDTIVLQAFGIMCVEPPKKN